MNTLADLVFHLRDHSGSRRRLLAASRAGVVRSMSAPELVADVHALALALEAGGVRQGDRVAIWSENRPGWHVVDLAVQLAGAVTVPLWAEAEPERVAFVLRNSATAWIFADAERCIRMQALQATLTHPPTVISLDEVGDGTTLTGLLGRGAALSGMTPLERLRDRVAPSELSTLLYTPGTTGEPKGVRLSHRALASAIEPLAEALELGPDDEALSLTALAHPAERTAAHAFLYAGTRVTYGDTTDALAALGAVRPTVLLTLSRDLESIHRSIDQRWRERGHHQWSRFWRAVGRAAASRQHLVSRRPGVKARLASRIARFRLREIKGQTGGRLRLALAYGAPLAPETEELLEAAGVPTARAYGTAEVGAFLTLTRGRWRPGSVGRPLAKSKLHRRADGELLARGAGRMNGYWQEPDGAAFDEDGWFLTGDLGRFDLDGFLYLEGRRSESVVTSSGRRVSLAALEGRLGLEPAIRRAVVVGIGRPALAALIVPRSLGNPEVVSGAAWPEVEAAIEAVNRRLAPAERIARFFLLPRPLSAARGELTPSGQLHRPVVHEQWATEIESMYSSGYPTPPADRPAPRPPARR